MGQKWLAILQEGDFFLGITQKPFRTRAGTEMLTFLFTDRYEQPHTLSGAAQRCVNTVIVMAESFEGFVHSDFARVQYTGDRTDHAAASLLARLFVEGINVPDDIQPAGEDDKTKMIHYEGLRDLHRQTVQIVGTPVRVDDALAQYADGPVVMLGSERNWMHR